MGKRLILIIFYLLYCIKSFSQVPAGKDDNWQLNINLSDEFNDNQINTSKWKIFNYNYCCSYSPFITSFATLNNGFLELKADNYYGGISSSGIETINSNYLYGYYEMRAKLPGYLNSATNLPSNQGFWTAFWTYYQTRDAGNNITAHNEIDILEPSGLDGSSYLQGVENDAKTNEVGCWMYTGNGQITKYGSYVLNNLPPLYEDFHKFAVEYSPNKLVYYFDDIPFHIVTNQPSYPTLFMKVVLANQLQQAQNINSNTPWPMIFKIDYFRFYQLNNDNCNNDAYLLSINDINNYQYGVRSNIYIGNSNTSINLSNIDSKTYRAQNITLISGEFNCPIGCELNIIPTQCN